MSDDTLTHNRCRLAALIVVGELAVGQAFAVDGAEPVGPAAMRTGRYLGQRRRCSMQAIGQGLEALLGDELHVFPIGLVGDDEWGRMLRLEMAEAGLHVRYIHTAVGVKTLAEVVLVFGKGEPAVLRASESPNSLLTAAGVGLAEVSFANYAELALVLVLPGVPLAARAQALDFATRYHCLRVGRFLADEIPEALATGLIAQLDVAVLSVAEAGAVVGVSLEGRDVLAVVKAAVWKLRHMQREQVVVVTGGAAGAWVWDGKELIFESRWDETEATGKEQDDLFIAGFLTALCLGESLELGLRLGNLCAALAGRGGDTLPAVLGRKAMCELAVASTRQLDESLWKLLREP